MYEEAFCCNECAYTCLCLIEMVIQPENMINGKQRSSASHFFVFWGINQLDVISGCLHIWALTIKKPCSVFVSSCPS